MALNLISGRKRVVAQAFITALVALILLGFEPALIGHRAAVAAPLPKLPAPLEQILEQVGLSPGDAGARLFGDWSAAFQVPVRNAAFADIMAQGRRADVVVPVTHALFAPEAASVGLWHSDFFLENYGTALLLAAPWADDRIPVVLVPGIGGSPRDFADMVPMLQRAGYQPVIFYYPSGMPLAGAAQQLAARMQELVERHSVTRLGVIGHSMGGLVSKGVLDQVDVSDALPSWRVFISISAPFGGVISAQYAEQLPRRPPAWDDLASTSPFMQKIQSTGVPSDLAFYLVFGARSTRRVMSALGNNDGVLTVDSMVGSPVTNGARDVLGFYEDHTSILSAPLVFRHLEDVLAGEFAH